MSAADSVSVSPVIQGVPPGRDAAAQAQNWLDRLAAFVDGRSTGDGLFREESYWRDALAFTWDISTVASEGAIREALSEFRDAAGATGFVVAEEPPARVRGRAGLTVIEAFFDFRTRHGRGRGVVRLAAGDVGAPPEGCLAGYDRAWTLLTTLQELDGAEERTGSRQPRGGHYAHAFGRENWRDLRETAREYCDRDPDVLIVGGGQAGLTLAARLGQMGVDALIVDRNSRVGDNWRKRYHALTLHNEAWVCDLPYLPYPPTWPVYLPKDMIADWFETYVWALELNFWTATELLGATFDDACHRWTVRLRRDGVERVMSPSHLVVATGMSGGAKIPNLPGLSDFNGEVLHTGRYGSGERWKGRHALVVGTGNSAHDVAQDLHANGAAVTMVQRSPTTIVSVEPAAQLVFALYSEGPSRADCDLLSVSMPYDVMVRGQRLLTRQMLDLDKDLLAGLERVGFRTDIGPDGSGYYMKYLRHGGGYYLNVGCSELIAAGAIKVVQNDDVERYGPDGVRMRDGTVVPADVIVLATGYENMQEGVRDLLGDEIADKVGPVWGFDEHGDIRGVWKQTGQENLWIMAGSFAQCRTYSRFVALQIQAIRSGLVTHRAVAPTVQS